MGLPLAALTEPSAQRSAPAAGRTPPHPGVADREWSLVPRLLLRRAGFGLSMVQELTGPDVIRAAQEYRAAVLEVDRARERLLGQTLPAAVAQLRRAPEQAPPPGDDGAGRAALRRLSGLRAAVGRRRELPADLPQGLPADLAAALAGPLSQYRDAVARRQAADHALAETVGRERADSARRVRGALTPQVLDALVQLAPSCYDGVVRWLASGGSSATAKDRAMLRRLYRYLQRLAAKNETTSSFGPLVHGVVEPGEVPGGRAAGTQPAAGPDLGELIRDGVRFGPVTSSGVLATQPFVAFWAVAELARRMAEDPRVRAHVPITWVPANVLQGDRLTLVTGQVVTLTRDQARLAAAVDGRRTATDLAGAVGIDVGRTQETLARLRRLGVVRTWPEPASVVSQPFADLVADARRLAGHTEWPQRLRELGALAEAFAAAPDHPRRRAALAALEEHFHELTQVSARRAGGQVYADRMVAYLECEGDLGPVRVDERLAERIERELSPVLDLGLRLGELAWQQYQATARQVLRAADVHTMPYDEFVRRLQATPDPAAPDAFRADGTGAGPSGRPVDGKPAGSAADLIARLTELVRNRVVGQVCSLSPQELRAIGARPSGPSDGLPGWPCAWFASPDLMIRAVPGDRAEPLLVIGEIHPYVFAWGSQRHFCPDPEGLEADFAAELGCWGGAARMAAVVPRRRHKGLIAHTFPGRFVELTAVASRDRSRTLPLTDLLVEDTGDRVRLQDGTGEVVLYAGQDDHPHLLAFAPPPVTPFPLIRLGDRAPRIVVGSLVAQRAGWWLAAQELTAGRRDGDGGFACVQRLRARHGIPRWVYAHVAGEPKPVCSDLDSPLAVDTLLAMVAGRPEETVALREMLPEPSALWLHRDGRAHTSELRLALVRRRS